MAGNYRLAALSCHSGGSSSQRRAPQRNRLARYHSAAAILALAAMGGCGGISPLTSVSDLNFRLVDEQTEWYAGNELVPPGSRLTLEATATGVTRDGADSGRVVQSPLRCR